jgi:hypothetical protein
MGHQVKEHFTLDSLIDESLDIKETDAHMRAIRLSEAQTEQIPLQSTPPLGMLSMRQKANLRTGVLT